MSIRLVVVCIALFFCVPSFGQTSDTTTYDFVAEMPAFPGGKEAFVKYFVKQLKVSNEDVSYFTNRVSVQFIVETDGKLTHFQVLRPDDMPAKTRKKVRKAFTSGPRWIPGKHEGRTVRVRVSLPMHIRFESFAAPEGPHYHL